MSLMQELGMLIGRHAGEARPQVAHTNIPGLIVAASSSPTEPLHHIFEPVFVLVIQGVKKIELGDSAFRYGSGEYLVVSVDLPISSCVDRASVDIPCLSVALTLKPAAIATLLLETAGDARHSGEGNLAGLGVSNAPPELLDAVLRMLRLLDRPRDARVLAPSIEREILWWLLCGPQGSMVRQIGLADSRLSQITCAVRWIRANYARALRIDDLSELAGMSVSTFHRHFRAITTMTPLQYQKQVRLQEARVRLLSQAADAATIGFSVGYNSPSQFTREYSRFYGITPGRDAAQLKTPTTSEEDLIRGQ